VRSAMPTLVEFGGRRLKVGVPPGWDELPPLPGVPLLAREVDGGGRGRFRSNLTVSAGPLDALPELDPRQAGDALAAELHGVLIDALPADGGALLVVAHDVGAGEVVCVQRQLRVTDHTFAVTYTVAVDRFTDEQPELIRLARAVRPAP